MTLSGTIDKIFFQNQENAWAAVLVNTGSSDTSRSIFTAPQTVKASGIMPGLRLGMTVSLEGEMEMGKWGQTLKVSSFSEMLPSDTEGIEKYLSSGLIKNIGPVLAKEIVKTFGEKTLEVLDNEPERLKEVYGVGKKRVESIISSVKEQKELRRIMIWLKRYDISNSLSAKIYKAYGEQSVANLETNPYRLTDDIKGVGFRKSDEVARRLGIAEDSPFRISSGLKACLEDWASEGNTYMSVDELVSRTASADYLSLDEETVRTYLLSGDDCPIIINGGDASLLAYYVAEEVIARSIRRLKAEPVKNTEKTDFDALEKYTGVHYSDEQRLAITTSLSNKITIITGGPGTGKTVTTNAIITELESRQKEVLLAAPTGRAAKRMNEVSGHDAQTIHRLLEFAPPGLFMRDEYNKLEGDALIVDEASMIDTLLMKNLLRAVPDNMQLIIVGDVDQLPSVGAGCVLRDLIDSGAVPTVKLTEIYRQAQDSDIIMNAHAVNNGRIPATDNHEGTDFWFFQKADRNEAAEVIVDLVANKVTRKFGYTKDDIQVLTPMKREGDPLGAAVLNNRLQQVCNPSGESVATRGTTQFRVGDRIMQTKNDYDKGVFNGDIGRIVGKSDETDEGNTLLVAEIDGRSVGYSRADLANIELAYACTVHKSQGSEYPVVIMPVHESQYIMLRKNLLYTGITRAKKQCIIVGTRRAFAEGVSREDTKKRFTRLKEKINQSC